MEQIIGRLLGHFYLPLEPPEKPFGLLLRYSYTSPWRLDPKPQIIPQNPPKPCIHCNLVIPSAVNGANYNFLNR